MKPVMFAFKKKIIAIVLSSILFTVFSPQLLFAQTTETPSPTNSPTPTPSTGAVTSTPTCVPVSAPNLSSAVATSSSQIVLTWTAPSTAVDHYLLSYGTAPGNYIYGNPSIDGSVTTYTVSYLSKGIKYYFAMKAANACSISSFSSEVSATAGQMATPSPSPTIVQQAPPPPVYQQQQQAVPNQQVQAAQANQAGFVSIPTYTPTPTESPLGSTVNVVSYTGAAVVIFIVCASLFYWLQSRQQGSARSNSSSEKTVF